MRARSLIAVVTLLAAGCGSTDQQKIECAAWTASDSSSARAWPPARTGYHNPIPDENQLPGTPDWRGNPWTWASPQVEAYADQVSARAGDRVLVFVRSDKARSVHWSVFRLGWYDGVGARQVLDGASLHVGEQPACPRDGRTGLVQCAWNPTFHFDVGADWVSGLYVVRLQVDDKMQWVPVVITDDRPADLLVQVPVTTWQAYNAWGGESLYADASGTMPDGRAVQVSFDRPYTGNGTSTLLDREAHFARFVEHWGYDVTYTTNLDVAAGGWDKLFQRGAFVSVGHDEYWPSWERNAVEAARDLGVPLLFFGANDAYWKIRLDARPDHNPRSFTCYKSSDDPVTGPEETGQYRMMGRPESGLIGEMYESWVYRTFPWVVANEHHFMFEGTGLHDGDALPLLVGDEYDRTFNECAPGNVRVAARSPVVDTLGRPRIAETISYRAGSGALVFAAGTIDWAEGLGRPGAYDPRIERMTANVIKAAVGIAVPDGLGADELPALADPIYVDPALVVGTSVNGLTGPSSVAVMPDGTLAVTEPDLDRVVTVAPDPPRQLTILAGNKSVFDGKTERPAVGLHQPAAVAADDKGNLFIADTGNHCIRKIGADPRHTMTTLAGSPGAAGFADGSGAQARFNLPYGLAVDVGHGLLYVADSGNHRVRAIELGTGKTRTIAGSGQGSADGSGAAASFNAPTAVALAPDGRVFVICSGGVPRIAVIAPDGARQVTTLVGGGEGAVDGDGTAARIGPQGGAVWHEGLLVVSDPSNYLVRAIAPGVDAASTQVATLAGSKRFGRDDSDVSDASFGLPLGLGVDVDGSLLIVDGHNGSVRAVH